MKATIYSIAALACLLSCSDALQNRTMDQQSPAKLDSTQPTPSMLQGGTLPLDTHDKSVSRDVLGLQPIVNDQVWKDTSGHPLRVQGGGILKVGNTFYWYGNGMDSTVKCYSSDDLVHWKFENNALSNNGWNGRPDVIFNKTTQKYVLIVESSNGNGRNTLAYHTSDTPCGNFVWAKSDERVFGYTMGDHSVFKDSDERAYVVYTYDKSGQNSAMGIAELNADYLGLKSVTAQFKNGGGSCEAGNIFKAGATYYLFSSDCQWWNSSATMMRSSTDLKTWSALKKVRTSPASGDSFNTQTDFVLTVSGTKTTSYIYCGDRYSQYTHKGTGWNAWYPLILGAGADPIIEGDTSWAIDVVTGEVKVH